MTPQTTTVTLADKYVLTEGEVFLSGVQALVRLPLDQQRFDAARGQRTGVLVSGYPGSPLGGYDIELDRNRALLADHDVVHQSAVNEELAATAIWGTQVVDQLPDPRFDGVVGLWYGKAPGLDRASDSIRHANLSGTPRTGGAVALVGDDPMGKSSTVPSSSEATLAALQLPILAPGDVQEVLDLGLHAVALSRSAGVWVGLKVATSVADGFGTIAVGADRIVPVMVTPELDGRPYAHVPSMRMVGQRILDLEHSLLYARLVAARAYDRANAINRITQRAAGDRLGIVAVGKAYHELREVLRDFGLSSARDLERVGVRLLQVRMPFPLDGGLVREFADGLDEVLVLEDKQALVERQIKDELFNLAQRPAVIGKRDAEGAPLVALGGELDADVIAPVVGARLVARDAALTQIADRLARHVPATLGALPVARTPYYCSGCPHNTSTTQLPDGAIVGAGIGCHGMAVIMREEEVGQVTGLTQMGGEGAQYIGQSPFTGVDHIFQNLGDGTFHHSGSLAIRAAVGAGINITYKLLWNSHVAMTGGQRPTAQMTLPAVTRWLAAEGVRRVIVTSDEPGRWEGVELAPGVEVWDRDRIVAAQEALRAVPGTTVLIHDQECAAEKRRARKRGLLEDPARRIFINARVCEGCGDCGAKSNCLSVQPVETDFGRKTQIHQASCNKDYSCLDGDCPSFLAITPGETTRPAVDKLAAADLPAPATAAIPDGGFGIRIVGIGGTGIVTVAQTVAMAARLEGLSVRGLDQTGMAQKGGPVVSDVKISREPLEQGQKLGLSACDLYLAADVLAGADAKNLAVVDGERSVAVISTAHVPTGLMVVDTGTAFPQEALLVGRIVGATRGERAVRLDAQAVSERLFGTDIAANMLLLGAALQAGALPVSAASVEAAIGLNGAAVALNEQALRRGRQAVADPDGLRRALEGAAPPAPAPAPPSARERRIAARVAAPVGSRLQELVLSRVQELTAYQSPAYAARYADVVERVRAGEAARAPGHGALAEAVAFGLHKLMAYKDEYEVARLHLDPHLRWAIEQEFGQGATFTWMLHPPMLRALGMDRKIALGAWFEPGFKALHKLRRVRGTRLDVFGLAHVRKVERELIDEYRALVDQVLAALTPANHAIAVQLAELPDLVRGYEEVKLAGAERFRARRAELLAALNAAAQPAATAAA